MDNNILSDFIIHKGLDGVYKAVKRDNYTDLFSNLDNVKYRSRSIDTLEKLIIMTNGDSDKLPGSIGS